MLVFVFKTSVKTKKDIEALAPYLDTVTQQRLWNFDLEDIDNILRVESPHDISLEIAFILFAKGFECEELMD